MSKNKRLVVPVTEVYGDAANLYYVNVGCLDPDGDSSHMVYVAATRGQVVLGGLIVIEKTDDVWHSYPVWKVVDKQVRTKQ